MAKLPDRTADTMSDAIALSSPSGRMSKRQRRIAQERLSKALFGETGLARPRGRSVSEREQKLRQAQTLRELADRGMCVRKYRKEAARLEAEAAACEDNV